MITSRATVRVLGPDDLGAVLRLTAQDPVANVFAEHRARATSLDPRLLYGEFLGVFDSHGTLVAAAHSGANLVPINCTASHAEQLAHKLRYRRRQIGTLLGSRTQVEAMYAVLRHPWGEARDQRWSQPHLVLDRASVLPSDGMVRRAAAADLEALYPACVAMYTEEVGNSPEAGGHKAAYRARVAQLISRGWSFVRIERGQVIFKAEVACLTPYAAQIQGVWTHPGRRGEGLATAGMAAVVNAVLSDLAPAVSLYVNAGNVSARRVYERVGFAQMGEFSTIMW